MAEAIAFISWGRWVADCPHGCGNARVVRPGETVFVCVPPPEENGCGRSAPLAWPADAVKRMASMAGRPVGHRSDAVPGSPQDAPPDPPVVGGDDLVGNLS